MGESLTRRNLFKQGAASAVALGVLGGRAGAAEEKPWKLKGRIKHSIVSWCFMATGDKWPLEQLCGHAKELGVPSIELVGPTAWPTLKQHGLTCAIASSGVSGKAFMRGLNNPRHQDEVVAKTIETIEKCGGEKIERVIAFTGYKWNDPDDPASGEISREEGAANTVRGLKRLAAAGEKHGVTICIEHLNTRDDSHPMKGHPGYQGDDLDYLAGIVRQVGSPRVKLLFDIYHVQIMHGDVIRRLDQCREILGHIHTAGNPGRGELDDRQEINYPPIMQKLVEMEYAGYVGQEFIPTGPALAGLKQALLACDV